MLQPLQSPEVFATSPSHHAASYSLKQPQTNPTKQALLRDSCATQAKQNKTEQQHGQFHTETLGKHEVTVLSQVAFICLL